MHYYTKSLVKYKFKGYVVYCVCLVPSGITHITALVPLGYIRELAMSLKIRPLAALYPPPHNFY